METVFAHIVFLVVYAVVHIGGIKNEKTPPYNREGSRLDYCADLSNKIVGTANEINESGEF